MSIDRPLGQLNEAPPKSMIILVGTPGAGKSSLCHQIALNNLATSRPVISVTAENTPSDIIRFLREKGLGDMPSIDIAW